MRRVTAEELKAIIEKHGRWLRGESGGARADLTGADLTGASLCSVSGSLFPDKGEQPTVFFFTEKMVGPEVDEAFAAVAFELFGKRFTIEEAKEYSLTGKPVTINKRTAIFQCMPF